MCTYSLYYSVVYVKKNSKQIHKSTKEASLGFQTQLTQYCVCINNKKDHHKYKQQIGWTTYMLQPVLKPNTLPSPHNMFSPFLIHYFGETTNV